MGNTYELPKLEYEYNALTPFMSEEQLKIHHQKHHQAYVNGANAIFDKMGKARKEGSDFDVKATLKELSFNIGGHLLHSLFWGNLAPAGKGETPAGKLKEMIDAEFGSYERFKKEFAAAAQSTEGSGWTALSYCEMTDRLVIMQIEKHNTNVYPSFAILMVLDVFEHAYYIDYKNDRAKFIESFWNIVSWDKVGQRLKEALA